MNAVWKFIVNIIRFLLLIYLIVFIFLKVYIVIDKSLNTVFINIRGYGIYKVENTYNKEYQKGTVIILKKYENEQINVGDFIFYDDNNEGKFKEVLYIENGKYIVGYEEENGEEKIAIEVSKPNIEALPYLHSNKVNIIYNICFSWITAVISALVIFLTSKTGYER